MTDIAPIKLEVKADLTKTLLELSQIPGKACSKIYNLLLGGVEARRAYLTACQKAQENKDILAIENGSAVFDPVNKRVVPFELPSPPFSDPFAVFEHQKEKENLLENLKVALKITSKSNDEQVSDRDIDPDWFARWRREAKVIGKPDLQEIWGRILAEEAMEPGRLSYRTLDVLKNISSCDAAVFNRVAKFAIDGQLLVFKGDENGTPHFTFGDCQQLADAGLILSISTTIRWLGRSNPSSEERFSEGKGFVIYAKPKKSSAQPYGPFPGLRLSSAGKELLSIVDIMPPSHEELKEIFDIVVEFNKIHDYSQRISLFTSSGAQDNTHHLLFEKYI